MKCSYPKELLPKPYYRDNMLEDLSKLGKISLSVADIEGFYLIHTLDNGASLHSYHQLLENFTTYFKPDRFVNGMSMNLASIYGKRHTQFIVDYKTNTGAKDPWKLGDLSILPFRNMKRKKSAGYFGMKIADILNIRRKLPMMNNEGATKDTFLITTVIEHKPTKCNYWHFEIYLHAEDLDDTSEDYKGKMTNLAQKNIISKNQVRVVPGKILQEFKRIAKMRSEIIAFHIPEEYYLQ